MFALAAAWQESMQDILVGLTLGVGILVLILIVVILLGFGALILRWLARQFTAIDARLAGFGQSTTGQYVYGQVQTLGRQFDEVTDQPIVQATAFMNAMLKELPSIFRLALPIKQEALTEADVLGAVNVVRNGILELLNGVPLQAQTPEELLNYLRKQKAWSSGQVFDPAVNDDWLKPANG